jgi:type IV pilus assembly protein PilQ
MTIRIPSNIRGGLAALALALASPLAWAQGAAKNAVESINFATVQGGKIQVKVGMKEPLAAAPQGFAVTNPPRIAVDLPDTVNATAARRSRRVKATCAASRSSRRPAARAW